MFKSAYFTKRIFYLNLLVFLLQLIFPTISNIYSLHGFNNGFGITQLITYQFLHGNVPHIIFNMLAFLSFGGDVEEYLGGKRFLVYYLVCGIIAGLIQISLSNNSISIVVGASGSIFGVMWMYTLLNPNRKITIFPLMFFSFRVKYVMTIILLFEVYSSFYSGDGVGHLAHVSGSLCGMLFIIYERYIRKNARFTN